jgi:hypothetical protein
MSSVEQARVILDLKKLNLPPRPLVESIEVEEYVTWDGDDALRVQVILGEDTTDDDITGEAVIAIKSAIHDSLLAAGIEKFPYTSFVKRSELDELDSAE